MWYQRIQEIILVVMLGKMKRSKTHSERRWFYVNFTLQYFTFTYRVNEQILGRKLSCRSAQSKKDTLPLILICPLLPHFSILSLGRPCLGESRVASTERDMFYIQLATRHCQAVVRKFSINGRTDGPFSTFLRAFIPSAGVLGLCLS